MKNNFAIIGGSGLYKIDGARIVHEHQIETPYGQTSDTIKEIELEDKNFFFLARHGANHHLTPSEVNYRANIFALKKLGIDYIVSISAVGSLKEELEPTHVVLPDQFIDRTQGRRERTFFKDGMVGHTSLAHPINKNLQKYLYEACKKADVNCHVGGAYVCIEGPQFSTRAESLLYRQWGADIIGMTNVPESYLAKEAGMAYATIAMVTDFDAWKDEHCTLEEIMKVVANNKDSSHKIVKEIIHIMDEEEIPFEKENQNVVMTPKESLSSENQEILKTLLS